jgi:hypothetical protein
LNNLRAANLDHVVLGHLNDNSSTIEDQLLSTNSYTINGDIFQDFGFEDTSVMSALEGIFAEMEGFSHTKWMIV